MSPPEKLADSSYPSGQESPPKSLARILEYWYRVEHFVPYEPKAKDPGSELVELRANDDLPWLNPAKYELVASEGRTFRHTVYLGVFRKTEIIRTLRATLGRVDSEGEDRYYGTACLGAVDVDHEGGMIEGSFQLSTMPWAMAQLVRGARAPEEWEQRFGECAAAAADKVRGARPDDRPCQLDDLRRATDLVFAQVGWAPASSSLAATWRCVKLDRQVSADPDEDADDIVNSLSLSDLRHVLHRVQAADISRPLKVYLGGAEPGPRIDLREDCPPRRDAASAARLPRARWPGDDWKPLNLMQQVSVNVALEELRGAGGLFAVNGPPGTGKTTLLRDLIAAIVTDRAFALAAFDDPCIAFTVAGHVAMNGKSLPAFALDPRITGREIVVASSNNAAVENVTKTIPSMDAIGTAYREKLATPERRYFGVVAEALRSGSWGLLAAVLGNAKNRDTFAQRFWWKGVRDREAPTFQNHPHGAAPRDWEAARKSFREAAERVEALIADRRGVEEALARKADCATAIAHLVERRAAEEEKRSALTGLLDTRRQDIARAEVERQQCSTRIATFRAARPSLLEWLLHWRHALRHFRQVAHARERLHAADSAAEEAREQLRAAEADLSSSTDRLRALETDLTEARRDMDRLAARLAEARGALGGALADDEFWSRDEREVQKSSPWGTPELAAARAEMFLRALELQQAFIEAAAGRVRANLSLLMDIFKGRLAVRDYPALVPHLWRTFFLVVPVVSTTFASVGSLFRGLGCEALGWLFIDEAGQAPPQAAVGALWRARRAIVVGDPMQIEPVFTVPRAVTSELRGGSADVGAEWDPAATSVQALADRTSRWGAEVGEREKLWVGCPLRVHRRCLDPMFSISNAIAYGGLMVQATHHEDGEAPLGPSRWIDVVGSCKGRHWVPGQGDALLELLDTLFARADSPDVFVISPFRRVTAEATRVTVEHLVKARSMAKENACRWATSRIGTVHTFQGKEADTVILLLGLDSSQAGAAAVMTNPPNVINVAVTRARRRLYVIGDRALWTRFHPMARVAELLDVEAAALQHVPGERFLPRVQQ